MFRRIISIILASTLLFGCTGSTARINVKVIDTAPPVIKVINKTITEGDSLKISDLYTVEDNATRKPDIQIDGSFNADTDVSKLSSGEYKAIVTATDKEGNSAEAEIKLTVQPKPESEPEPEPTKPNSGSESNNIQQPQQPVTPVVPIQPIPTPTPTPTPEPEPVAPSAPATTKDFLFSDGYNMQTAMPACQAFSSNYAGFTGTRSCQPIQSADGLYTGVRFTYTP